MYSLLNRGIIPCDVDLSPAFERNSAPFKFNRAVIHQKQMTKPPQLSKPVSSPQSIVYRSQNIQPQQKPVDTTFLTQLNPQGNMDEHMQRITQNANLMKGQSDMKDMSNPYSKLSGLGMPFSQQEIRRNQDKDVVHTINRTSEMQPITSALQSQDGQRLNSANEYALVPKTDDIMTKTFQSFKL